MLTNIPLGEMAPNYGFGSDLLWVIDEQDLLDVFGTDYLATMIRGYKGEFTETELSAAAKILQDALGNFTPDVVITYTTAPFLRAAFPEALIFHMEYGLYSRAPFPESFYLDPMGKFSNSVLATHKSELRSYYPTEHETMLTQAITECYVDGILRPKSPFQSVEDIFRQKFDKMLLLPLQYGGHYGFDGTCIYSNQEDLLHDVVKSAPANTCILAVQHPTDVHVTHETIESNTLNVLREQHDNLFMASEFNQFLFPSQFMLAHVDAVASVSSSVALQGLLWDTTIVALGDSHLNTISDLEGVDKLSTLDATTINDKKKSVLSWLLSHYYIPASYLHNPEWLMSHLHRSLDKWRTGVRGLEFFEQIDNPNRMAEQICSAAMPNVPVVVTDNAT